MASAPIDKTAVITGATGQLGRQVQRAFEKEGWTVVGTGFSRAKPPTIRKVDLQNREEVVALLDECRPKVIVHCAAERFPDACEADPDRVKTLNIDSSRFLAQQAAQRGIFLIYISTDYVFPGAFGAKEVPYEADAEPAPPNFYGETKLGGERGVLEEAEAGAAGAVVLRVPVLYGQCEKNKESAVNVLMDAVWNLEGRRTWEMDHWSVRYPTNTEDVARVLKDIALKYTSTPTPAARAALPKILQFSAEERFTKYEICQVLAEIAGLPIDHLVPNDSYDPNSKVVRPYDCHLSTKALQSIGIDVSAVPFKIWW
ncbi:hypothetical protein DFH27DRAFT_88988 [Peziza echinospora]|nr:hypothetical protein DFH27DRAFT_88988 [Peziza echinospora]